MQRTLRLAPAQFNPTVDDMPGNTARIIEQIHEARAASGTGAFLRVSGLNHLR